MHPALPPNRLALAVAAALGAAAFSAAPTAQAKTPGTYQSGDFHNHTTCSDGSISMQKLVRKSTDKSDGNWGLDWFVQAGHGGSGNRNCTLVEDQSLATPVYPLQRNSAGAVAGPTTTWQNSPTPVQPKGDVSGTSPSQNMWRWQSLQEFQYQVVEYLSRYWNRPLFLGLESVAAGHEHVSMSIITGQMPKSLDTTPLQTTPGYNPVGNANALAQWEYCFDRADTDTSRGAANQWDCSVSGSLNANDPSWNNTAKKLIPASGAGNGTKGHAKTLEALKWMNQLHATTSYYVPAHLERAGPFNPDGNNGFNIEHLRNFNNVAPQIAFGFETQPGHGASDNRGEYSVNRNTIGGVKVDSVGGTTWGGTGVYGAQVGGVWDALLGEGRNWWFFASSDWHNRGQFGPDDRRSTQDFLPGEYQRNYTMVRDTGDVKVRPQAIVDGLRSGNNWASSGQLIDRLAFVACVGPGEKFGRAEASVRALAINAAIGNTDVDQLRCVTMGEKLSVRPGAEVVVAIVVRDPDGTNYSPYSFPNPSLLQVGIVQPLNQPKLDHVDLIRGEVTGYRTPGTPGYAGAWPNTWIKDPRLDTVPDAAKNTSAAVVRTFDAASWDTAPRDTQYKVMTFKTGPVLQSQYLRLRGTNIPHSVPYETDADGNPLADIYTNASDPSQLKIPCTTAGSGLPANGEAFTTGLINGCPNHLPVVNGQKMVAYDVAAWADLWFYSNPIFIEVIGQPVAGVK